MELENLGDSLNLILIKLNSEDKARFACVNPHFRVCAADESLWSAHCSEELHLSAPVDPFDYPLPSFKETYQVWRKAFSMYPWPLVKRVIRCYGKLKSWLKVNYPVALENLQTGATEDELNELEESLGVKLPAPSRVIYRLFDGQEMQRDRLCGVMGGYWFYDRLVNVCLLSLKDIHKHTEELRSMEWCSVTSKYLVVAISGFSDKKFLLECSTGQLFVGTVNLVDEGEMIPCVPSTLLNFRGSNDNNNDNDRLQDGLLLWLEEHLRRLENGIIGVRGEGQLKSISQFPELPPLSSTAVTNGVQVHASGVFVPEMSVLDDEKMYSFAYSIRMSLLPDGCTVHGTRHNSCQLYWRRWIIKENDIVVDDVNGEAVVGKYPLLTAGDEEEFVYESRCVLRSVRGSIEGSFTFVPGRLSDPKGENFEVVVERFPLELPDYIF